FWYEQALPDLTGLAKVRLDKRLQIVAARRPAPETISGPGKVKAGEIRQFTGHGAAVKHAGFTPDGQRSLSGSQDGTVRLWDVESGKELLKMQAAGKSVTRVAVLPNGKQGVSCANAAIQVWDLATGNEIRSINRAGAGTIWGLAVSPDGKQL